MLELARKLADNDEKFFGGWILAGAEVKISGGAKSLVNKTLLSKAHKAMLEVDGLDAHGALVKSLRVFLVLPPGSSPQAAPGKEEITGELIAAHTFTAGDVAEYVAYTGDRNIIHTGERPIVPGLCLLAWLERALALETLDWRISFLSPVYAGDKVKVYASGGKFSAYVGRTRVFANK